MSLRRTACLALVVAAAAPSASSAAAPRLPLPDCALGDVPSELRAPYRAALARAVRRHGGSAAERRRFARAVAAHVYGAGPVTVHQVVRRFVRNHIVSVAQLVDPRERSVQAPNNDTVYTVSWIDLSAGPHVIDVPDMGRRYYVLQLMDAYTNTIAYVGSRTTGTRPGAYLLAPRGWSGPVPAGVRLIRSPTNTLWLLGRTLIRGAGDLPAVKGLLAGISLTPLDRWASGPQAPIVLDAFPEREQPRAPAGAAYYETLRQALASDPPPAADRCALRAFELTPSAPADAARAARRIVMRMARVAERISARRNNGWLIPGANIGDFGRDYLTRAITAATAPGAQTRAEALYPLTTRDSRGRPLSARRRYALRFPRGGRPPARAFWSLTAYDEDSFLIENPIGRYSIGDRTRGLRRGRDGSLTLYVQRRAPRGARRANWLPVGRGRFSLMLRIYEPTRRARSWRPPAVVAR